MAPEFSISYNDTHVALKRVNALRKYLDTQSQPGGREAQVRKGGITNRRYELNDGLTVKFDWDGISVSGTVTGPDSEKANMSNTSFLLQDILEGLCDPTSTLVKDTTDEENRGYQ